MKNLLIFTLFSLLLVFGGSGCKKDLMSKSVWVSYNQTGCSDPWRGKTHSQEELKENIQEYFANKKSKISKIDFYQDKELVQLCLACSCLTGTVIKCLVHERDVNTFLKEGFYR